MFDDFNITGGVTGVGVYQPVSDILPSSVSPGLNSYDTLSFNGVDEYLYSTEDLFGVGDVSAVCVFKLNDTGTTPTGYIVDNNALGLYYNRAEAKIGITSDSGNTNVLIDSPISTGTWYIAGFSRASDGQTNLYMSNSDDGPGYTMFDIAGTGYENAGTPVLP